MTTTGKLQKSFRDNLHCPNGCEAAIAVREEEDEVFYRDRDLDTGEIIKYSVAVRVPVFFCERCDFGWTDYRAEDIRNAAVVAEKMARQIDYEVVQSLK